MDDLNTMTLFSSVEHNDDNSDKIIVTSEMSEKEMLDYVVLVMSRHLVTSEVFKEAGLLYVDVSKLPNDEYTAATLQNRLYYIKIKNSLETIAEKFIEENVIASYDITDEIAPNTAGSISFYNSKNEKLISIIIKYNDLGFGTASYTFSFADLQRFGIERILADKIIAIITSKNLKRTKDLYDLWVLPISFNFSYSKLLDYIELQGGIQCTDLAVNDDEFVPYAIPWDEFNIVDLNGNPLEKPHFRDVLRTLNVLVSNLLYARDGSSHCLDDISTLALNKTYVMCGASALHYAGLALPNGKCIDLMTQEELLDNCSLSYVTYYYYENIDYEYKLHPSKENPLVLIPSKERALVEYIKNEKWCDEGTLIEAMKTYLMWFRNDKELHEVADHFSLDWSTVEYWIKEAEEDYEV